MLQREFSNFLGFSFDVVAWEPLEVGCFYKRFGGWRIFPNSIPDRMASNSDSLFEALKPSRIACLILSPLGDFSYRPMPAPVCRDAPSTLKVHQFKLFGNVSVWGISTRKFARTCPFLDNLGLYWILYSLSSIAQRAILPDKSSL